jgi:hypothetical protein
LHNNKLSSLPSIGNDLAYLNELTLDYNTLPDIEVVSSLKECKHLRRLTLHNNLFAESILKAIDEMGALAFIQHTGEPPRSAGKASPRRSKILSRSPLSKSPMNTGTFEESEVSTPKKDEGKALQSNLTPEQFKEAFEKLLVPPKKDLYR